MSRVCQVTGKKVVSGNHVSHAKNRVRRKFKVNIHKKEKGSYIIVGHLNTVKIAYKYFNQKNNSILNIKNNYQDPIKGGPAGVNTIVGFKDTDGEYEMIYKPNNNFK